jgi:hypothetical protein
MHRQNPNDMLQSGRDFIRGYQRYIEQVPGAFQKMYNKAFKIKGEKQKRKRRRA